MPLPRKLGKLKVILEIRNASQRNDRQKLTQKNIEKHHSFELKRARGELATRRISTSRRAATRLALRQDEDDAPASEKLVVVMLCLGSRQNAAGPNSRKCFWHNVLSMLQTKIDYGRVPYMKE